MFLNRVKLLIKRYLKAKSFGFLFFAARYFYIPKSIKINNKIINLSDGKGIVEAIKYLIKKKQVNIYKFNNLQITINSKTELYNAKLKYNKYFTLNESNKK